MNNGWKAEGDTVRTRYEYEYKYEYGIMLLGLRVVRYTLPSDLHVSATVPFQKEK